MDNYGRFTGLYPLQKTLRFELRPQGRTMEHLENSKFFEQDKDRAEKYVVLKKVIDDYHNIFIKECLSKLSLEWAPLRDASVKYYGDKEEKDRKNPGLENNSASARKDTMEKDRKELEAEQKRMRKEIASAFKNDDHFRYLFSEKLFSVLLKDYINKRGIKQEIEALESFNRFSGYFIGLHENRANMYSDKNESTAIANRIVNENFPKFLDNLIKFEEVRRIYPELIQETETALAAHKIKMDDFFSLEKFNNVLTQDGINKYNLAIGGDPLEAGERQQGLNEFLNKASQNDGRKRIRMTPLFKQILSDPGPSSYKLDAFTEDSQLISSINSFFTDIENDEDGDTFDRAVKLIASYSCYDKSKIYIRQADLSKISMEIFGNWEMLRTLLIAYKAVSLGDNYLEKTSKKVEKWLSEERFSLLEITKAIAMSGQSKTFDDYVMKMREAREKINPKSMRNLKCIKGNISGDEESILIVKTILDSVKKFFHFFGPFEVRADLPQDGDFYAEFNDINKKLSAIIPLYNRARDHLTKNNLSTKKIKLNFKNPTLASGWDLNKEYENTAVIFLRGGKYYLGIMNPKKKKNIKFEEGSSEGPFYQKMAYKLLPGPNKMLPKVFFAKKNIGYYDPSKEILEGYKAGKHKKGDNFDKEFCHKLIDFFKEAIQKNEDWKVFDFKFSPTESYNDISEFYIEVEKQGYKMYFLNIPVAKIDEYVEKGDMFLFQIYNKDFAKGVKADSRMDMHTIYWNAAFSEENLRNIVVKLDGEAELFYRDKSGIYNPIVHKKGDMLVNRTYDDKTPVPDSIHKELFDYHNGRPKTPSKGEETIDKYAYVKNGLTKTLSEEAKGYLDKVGAFQAYFDIIKDRRYLENKMYFHVPLTLNFKASGKKNVNKMAIEKFLTDKDAHIIGIDRGEKNLLYYSVIDRNGKIIDQNSFNIIDGFDYQKKLSQREAERDEARRSWNAIGKIKDLKEGYLSKVVHELSKMAVERNAIVVLEDLNYEFKRGRLKVEKQVYQKFEKMLIDKLNYLVFKDVPDSSSMGGVLSAYQLTFPLESFSKLGKQSGILFYVPAEYTSKIDPTTGFVNLFNTSTIADTSKKDFLLKFESIAYSAKDGGIFAFKFDYRDFIKMNVHKNIWTVYTNGERTIYKKDGKLEITNPSMRIKGALSSSGIEYEDGQDLRDRIIQSGDNNVINEVYDSFLYALRMRNNDGENDYIISPVKNRKGEFFKTDPDCPDLPVDADANGAYNIALKGELMMRTIAKKFNPQSEKVTIPKIDRKDWFEFMQTRGD